MTAPRPFIRAIWLPDQPEPAYAAGSTPEERKWIEEAFARFRWDEKEEEKPCNANE